MLPLLVLLPVLAWVAVSDLLWRRIGNRLVLLLLVMVLLGMVRMLWVGAPPSAWSDVGFGAGCAVVVLVLGFVLFSAGWMGAGDVKLMAVLCLWLGDDAMVFLFLTALLGGALALAMPVVSHVERLLALTLARLAVALPFLSPRVPEIWGPPAASGLPYGVAIAAAAAAVALTGGNGITL